MPSVRRVALLLAPAALLLLGQSGLRAQLSPNCQRNGQAEACALTPGDSDADRRVMTVVFADHSAWRLEKNERRCRHNHPVSTCPAVITGANGNGTPLTGTYTGIWYEGGYRNVWSAPGIRIEYVYLD